MTESRQLTRLDQVCMTIDSPQMRDKFAQGLPPSITVDRFTRTALTAIQTKPDILECEPASIYSAIIKAASDGLLPDNRQGALVAFSAKVNGNWVKKAVFMIMVEGCIHKLTKAGVHAYAVSVYENDKISIWNDELGQHVKHEPVVFGDRGARVGAFAMGRVIKTGAPYVEAMGMEELIKARNASKTPDKGPWVEWPDRMEQKTVLHRLDKRVGTSALLDEEFEPETPQAGEGLSSFHPNSPAANPAPPGGS
jgi:recombination protein RecT